jgi:hypothetical protein
MLSPHSVPFLMYYLTWCPVSGTIIIPVWVMFVFGYLVEDVAEDGFVG